MIHEGAMTTGSFQLLNVSPVLQVMRRVNLANAGKWRRVDRLGLNAGCIMLAFLGRYAGVLAFKGSTHCFLLSSKVPGDE